MAAVVRTCASAARGLSRLRPVTLRAPSSKSISSVVRTGACDSRPVGRRCFSQEARPALTMLADHERMLKDTVHEFARSEIAPHVAKMDQEGKLVPSVLPALFANGFMGLEIDEKYGGGHMSFFESCLAIEEIAKVDPAIAVIVDIQNTLINTIFRRFGSQAIKDKWLPRLATDTLGSFCLSEHGSGSDAFALKTSAKRDGDYFYLNGTKMWISNANEAGVFIVFANADFSKTYKGITAFVVEGGAQGLQIGKVEDKLGIRASSTCEVIFDNVKVHKDSILGEEGKGYKIAIEALNEGRIGIGAQMVGLAQGAFDATMPYIMQRKQFGQVVANFQGMQFSYAQARTSIEAARLLVYNAARLKDAGKPFIQEAAMAKLYASQIAEQVASKAIEWCGGVGFTKSMPQEKYFRDAKIGSIYEGTTNLQLQTIAQLLQKQYH